MIHEFNVFSEKPNTIGSAVRLCIPVGESERAKDISLVKGLKRRGVDVRLGDGAGPDIIGNGFIFECKWDLIEKATLDRLIGQLCEYTAVGHNWIFVVIYNDVRKSLLKALKDFCASYWGRATFDITVLGNEL